VSFFRAFLKMHTIHNTSSQKIRGNLAYQQHQQIRRHHLERKQTLRKLFEMGKVVEKAGFGLEELNVIYGILVEAKEKQKIQETKNIGMT
jgi:hypothetical protein